MAEPSHVKITGADNSRNVIIECQLTVQRHTKNTKLVHERYIRDCDCNAGRPVEFGDLQSCTSYDCLRFIGAEE